MIPHHTISLFPNQRFANMTADSREVREDTLFVAYEGLKNDGRAFIAQAIKQGASAVLWEKTSAFTWQADWRVPHLPVVKLKQQVGEIAAAFYGYPSAHVKVIGVTGTNGKTSVTQWLGQCLSQLGHKTAVMGTVGNTVFDPVHHDTSVCEIPLSFTQTTTATANTTPDPIIMQRLLAQYRTNQVDAVAMEVSSHGLDQGRVSGVAFDIAVFTNLSRDHLDYHGDMESYAAAKRKLFDWPTLRKAIINVEDAYGKTLAQALQARNTPCVTYGFNHGDVRASDVVLTHKGLQMQVNTPHGKAEIAVGVIGRFNAENLLAVLSTLLAMDVPLCDAVKVINHVMPVQGRMQQVGGDTMPLVVVDYAHTPDALEKILSTLKEQLSSSARLRCVFGCGGNRDIGKRSIMGTVASQIADWVVLTNDNPRDENPADILQAIQVGFPPEFAQYEVVQDRRAAIAKAIGDAAACDIVVIAGKGHEDYQEVAGRRSPFSDLDTAREILRDWQALASNTAPCNAIKPRQQPFSQIPPVIKGEMQ